MQPTGTANNGTVLRAARLRRGLVRIGIAVTVTLAGASADSSALGAEPTSTGTQTAEASNGGEASATTGGEVNIGQIVTGENTGNSISTGNVAGSAEIDGGEIDYPTDVTISLDVAPPIVTAEGGDEGTAEVSDDHAQSEEKGGNGGEDIKIINHNDNESRAKVVDKTEK